jgi:selenide, water dikinase
VSDPDLLVGMNTSDDAAVYRLTPELALVQTVDYITPLVDDPYQFGQIAATNSISDIYAMGARPLLALNVVAFPTDALPIAVLGEILRGGADKAREAGVRIIGGHSIDDKEPKYGMAVTGLVHPDRILRNSTARPGDRLLLTKPLGMGIISTAIKRDAASAELIQRAVAVMTTLNERAAQAAIDVGVNACTDITGFGLLGHLHEMTAGSGVGARISFQRVPLLEGVVELAAQGVVPGGTKRNLAYVQEFVTFAPTMNEVQRLVLADAQTSGGLLLAVSADRATALARALDANGVPVVAEIGVMTADRPGTISVEP